MIFYAKTLLSSLCNWSVKHVAREANKAAHILAQDAIQLDNNLYGMEEVPSCIMQTVSLDNV